VKNQKNKTAMNKLLFSVILLLLSTHIAHSQIFEAVGEKVPTQQKLQKPDANQFNKTDASGKKQGPWEKRYANGRIAYTATFKDDKPVGELIRYYESGKIKAKIVYDQNGIKGVAEMYDPIGVVIAKGKYLGSKKDSTWNFYTEKGILTSIETYNNGLKNGPSYVYFPNGVISEIINWQNDQKHGEWTQYSESGALRLKGNHHNGLIEGNYQVFYESGAKEITGTYKQGNQDGEWVFWGTDGKVMLKLIFNNGKLLNEEELNMEEQKLFNEFERNKGKLLDPEKHRNDPDAVLNKK
jgi:antitoxin component YwqK of YwqJK toxin-antitoxin module